MLVAIKIFSARSQQISHTRYTSPVLRFYEHLGGPALNLIHPSLPSATSNEGRLAALELDDHRS